MFKYTLLACLVLIPTRTLFGGVVEYRNEDRTQWFSDVGGVSNVSIVDFTGFPDFTPITDQWAHLGVHFSGNVFTSGFDDFAYPNDGWGVEGFPDINIVFDEPISWIAADFPGVTSIELYNGEELLFTSSLLGSGGPGHFGGLVSDFSFDRVRFIDPFGANADFLDDLFFGPPIPAPSAIAPLAMLCLMRRRKRRVTTAG